ncbi:MAG: adenylate kinase [Clostridiales bacterium]|nr:adenylate kinase [Clostridiales bacterium]
MRLIILGAPGSGKGTACAVLKDTYGLAHISTGDIFRENIKNGTPLGQEAKTYIDAGALVPDSVTIRMVEDRLTKDDCSKGFILDGFPRTIAQAEALDEILSKKDEAIDAVISVVTDDELIMDRVTTRRVCPSCGASYNVKYMPPKVEGKCDACGADIIQRSDDTAETVQKRLDTYYENTKPLIDFYAGRGLIVEGNNNVDPDQCISEIKSGLEARGLN